MVCRHGAGDTSCSSHPNNIAAREAEALSYRQKKEDEQRRKAERDKLTPFANKFEVLQGQRINRFVLLKVKYPSCTLCAHDGVKVLVLQDVTEFQLIGLKRIDPHFRPRDERVPGEAPSPVARFPGDQEGWSMAVKFVSFLTQGQK